jgi:hypothetical protein
VRDAVGEEIHHGERNPVELDRRALTLDLGDAALVHGPR